MLHIYGLKNCDSCRKAVKAFAAAGLSHTFHDLRAEGLETERLDGWLAQAGWEKLLNRKSTTWRALPEERRAGLDEAKARALLLANPTLIKRPVIEYAGELLVGFDRENQARFSAGA